MQEKYNLYKKKIFSMRKISNIKKISDKNVRKENKKRKNYWN
jgi:hypothetical protein